MQVPTPADGMAAPTASRTINLARVALGELVHVGGCDDGALAAVQREHRGLDEVVLLRVGRVDGERAGIDDILAVVQDDQLGRIVGAEHLREHLVQHLALRCRTRQAVDDDLHALGVLGLELLRDAQRAGVVGIDAEIERDLRDLNAREIALDHLSEDVFLVPVGDEDGGRGNDSLAVIELRHAAAYDAKSDKVDERVVDRRHANQHAHREEQDDKKLEHF